MTFSGPHRGPLRKPLRSVLQTAIHHLSSPELYDPMVLSRFRHVKSVTLSCFSLIFRLMLFLANSYYWNNAKRILRNGLKTSVERIVNRLATASSVWKIGVVHSCKMTALFVNTRNHIWFMFDILQF